MSESTLKGSDALRRRITAIQHTGPIVAQHWSDTAADRTREQIPVATGATRASVRGEASRDGGRVFGGGAIRYLAGGTRAHAEHPNQAKAMRFQASGRTIFSKRVQKPATPANPRIFQAARDALSGLAAVTTGLWNKGA